MGDRDRETYEYDEIQRLRAEVERLRGLVHTAYLEGIADHATGDGRCGLDLWSLSNARAALASKEG